MKTANRMSAKGFTLVEMLLVVVIISMIVYGATNIMTQRTEQARIDRSSLQMQQILNAALAYYVLNGSWPASISVLGAANLLGAGYPNSMKSPWGGSTYTAQPCPSTGGDSPMLFCVTVVTEGTRTGASSAQVLAGTLPLASVTGKSVTARVNIPGQNLNNARSVNFAGLYRNGGCIPVPTCPIDPSTSTQMTPQVMVVPVQVSGVNEQANPNNVYPISSFTAYATPAAANPNQCSSYSGASTCPASPASSSYWRACMQVVTELGDVASTNANWGSSVAMAAFTRCTVNNEPSGTSFSYSTR